jgi:hypothetical protein
VMYDCLVCRAACLAALRATPAMVEARANLAKAAALAQSMDDSQRHYKVRAVALRWPRRHMQPASLCRKP